jgi:uncharacterized protein (TIGR03067 family)
MRAIIPDIRTSSGRKTKPVKIFTILLFFLLWGCNSTPSPNRNPLEGTTWTYTNKKDDNKRYTLTFTTDTVTFTIFNKNGSVDQEPISGIYTLSGATLTEVYDDYTATSMYSRSKIVDSFDTKMVFKKKR